MIYYEEGVVGLGSNNLDFDFVFGILIGEIVKDIDIFLGVEVVDSLFLVNFESVFVRF